MGRNTTLSTVKIKVGANYHFNFMNILVHFVGYGGEGREDSKLAQSPKL